MNALTLDAASAQDLTRLTEQYEELRERVYKAAQANHGALMGPDAWLRHAMNELDLTVRASELGVNASGSCRSSQTCDTEFFDFFIYYEDLAGF